MALVIKDRAQETGTANTTVSFSLTATTAGFQSFSTVGNGNTTYYSATDASNNWETGLGTWATGGTLTRTTIFESSNSNAAVTFSGTVTVFGTYPADRAVYKDANSVVTNGDTLSYSDTGVLAAFASTTAGYNQTVLQNKDSGATSSTNITVANNNGSATTNYAEFGINSSGFTGSGSFNQPGYSYVASASTDLAIGTYGANGIHFLVNSGTTDAMVIDSSGNVGIGITPTGLDRLELGAGTTSKAPLGFTAGTNLTTPDPGTVEYDGSLLYFTPASTARALAGVSYYYRKNTATTLSSATGNQAIFALTNGATVQANTTYEVECEFQLSTSGTTSHTEAFGFTLATATVTNMGVTVNRLAGNTTSSALGAYLTSVTPVVVTGALTTAQTGIYRVKGTIAFGTGGSINPVIAFSAAPGGTSSIILGSWMKLTPIGATGGNVSIGTWA